MGDAPRTYEAPPVGADAAGLEDYVVEARGGKRVGSVVTLVENGGGVWLVVERGTPPLHRDRRLVGWDDVDGVDHDSLVVRLSLDPESLDGAPRVDDAAPGESAEARRVTSMPSGVPSAGATGDSAGPRDTGFWVVPLASTLLGVLTGLGLIIAVSLGDHESGSFYLLFLIPAALIGVGLVTLYRLWRDPYE